MSSIIKHKLSITNANEQVMREALPLLTHLGIKFQIGQNLTDYWHNSVETTGKTIVLNIEGNKYPVGISISNGTIQIVGDFHGAQVRSAQLEKAVKAVYTARVTQIAMAGMGFKTNVLADKEKHQLRVRGVGA